MLKSSMIEIECLIYISVIFKCTLQSSLSVSLADICVCIAICVIFSMFRIARVRSGNPDQNNIIIFNNQYNLWVILLKYASKVVNSCQNYLQ